MSDNNLDGNPTTGTTGTPNPSSSAGNGGDGSIDAKGLQSAIETLTKRLDEVDARSRSLQGEKDKGIKQTKKEVEELKRQIAEIEQLKKSGLDPDTAIEEFTFREEVRGLREQLAKLNPVSTPTAGNGVSGAETEAQRIAKELQLDLNDKDIADAMSRGVSELFKVAMSKKSNPPSASDAPPPSGRNPSSVDVDKIYAELQTLYKEPTKNKARIALLDKQLKETR